MRDFLIRLLGGFPDSERAIISHVAWNDGWNRGYNSGQDSSKHDEADSWKAGYRYAKDEWAASREVEDAELAELAMAMAKASM